MYKATVEYQTVNGWHTEERSFRSHEKGAEWVEDFLTQLRFMGMIPCRKAQVVKK